LLKPRHRHVGRIARKTEFAQALKRPPLGVCVADLRGDGVALFGELTPPRQLAAAEIDRRGPEQRPRPKNGGLRGGGERRVEAPLCLMQVDPSHPKRPQDDAEAQPLAGHAFE
jgi:hypothetical protein